MLEVKSDLYSIFIGDTISSRLILYSSADRLLPTRRPILKVLPPRGGPKYRPLMETEWVRLFFVCLFVCLFLGFIVS